MLCHIETEWAAAGVQAEYRGRICKRLRNPGIGSKESQAYVAWRAGTTNKVILPAG